MTSEPENRGQPFSNDDVKLLRQMVKEKTPTPLMAARLGRTDASVRKKARSLRLSVRYEGLPPKKRRRHGTPTQADT